MVMPLLLILVIGIVEFGFVLAQMNELRHGAREGARYAAVSRPDVNSDGTTGNNADVIQVVCDAINLPGMTVTVSLDGGVDRLDYANLTVTADTEPLTGFPLISSMLPDELTNEANFRLEQNAGWVPPFTAECT